MIGHHINLFRGRNDLEQTAGCRDDQRAVGIFHRNLGGVSQINESLGLPTATRALDQADNLAFVGSPVCDAFQGQYPRSRLDETIDPDFRYLVATPPVW